MIIGTHNTRVQIVAFLPIAAVAIVATLGGERSTTTIIAALFVAFTFPFGVVATLRGIQSCTSKTRKIFNQILLVIYGSFVLWVIGNLIYWFIWRNIT